MTGTNKVGIDRIILSVPFLEELNMDKLNDVEAIAMIGNKKQGFRVMKNEKGDNILVNSIRINKSKSNNIKTFNSLLIGNKITPGGTVHFNKLDVNLPSAIGLNNKNNISNIEDLKKVLSLIEAELKYLGFGVIDLSTSKIDSLEINTNILLESPFEKYESSLEYLKEMLPKRMMKIGQVYRPDGIYTGWKDGNASVTLKIYDKKKELIKQNQLIDSELLRIEYSLENSRKVKSILGNNNLNKLLEKDSFEYVEEIFKDMINRDIIRKIYPDIKMQVKHAQKNIIKYKKESGGTAINLYLKNHQRVLLDVEVLLEAQKKTTLQNHYARECRNTINSILNMDNCEMFLGTINKTNQILKALGFKEISINLTSTIKNEVAKYY